MSPRRFFSILLIAVVVTAYSNTPRRRHNTALIASLRRRPATAPTTASSKKWDVDVENEFVERIESVKSAVVGVAGGIAALLPLLVVQGISSSFSPQWEFHADSWALLLALFGITYRYAVRTDGNPNLKQGVVGAFAVTYALRIVSPPSSCTSLPLNCGPPLYYIDTTMIVSGLGAFGEACVGYGVAAYLLEKCFSSGFVKRFPSN